MALSLLHVQESLFARQRLAQHPAVTAAIRRHWVMLQQFRDASPNAMSKEEYIEYFGWCSVVIDEVMVTPDPSRSAPDGATKALLEVRFPVSLLLPALQLTDA
jgi:hypothetical protein